MKQKTNFLIPFMAFSVALLGRCSESDFASSTQKKPAPKPSPAAEALPEPSPPAETEAPVLESEIGTIEGCAAGTMVEDPNAKFTFAAGEATTFVNSLENYTKIPVVKWYAGSVHHDKVTADAVCRLKGYVASESMTGKGYHSCHNNNHGYWNESQKNFEI
ncbi:MAG: hypothetical protein NT027_12100 [Proteobacteria bacterium]|nr:hypothetical protein [Pseudomonadota bacterium]